MPPRPTKSPADDRPHGEPKPAPHRVPATPGAGFLPRLDYYLKLADGPVLPDDASTDAGNHLNGLSMGDTPMIDPQLEPASPHDTQAEASPRGAEDADRDVGGRLHTFPDGRTTFYGSGSLFHMFAPTPTLWDAGRVVSASREPLMPPDKHLLEQRLTDHYFLYDNFFLGTFTSELYRYEKTAFESGSRSQVYSPALGHAILAVGALYTDDPSDGDLSEEHSALARSLLAHELSAPRISSVLTLMALCSLSAANGQDSQGWIDSGTAFRLIHDIGLHLPTVQQSCPGTKDAVASLRQDMVMGVVALDTAWRNLTGRLAWDDGASLLTRQPAEFWPDAGLQGNGASCYTDLMLIQREFLRQRKFPADENSVQALLQSLQRWDEAAKDRHLASGEPEPMLIQTRIYYFSITMQQHKLPGWEPPCVWAATGPSPCERCADAAKQISRLRQEFKERHGLRKLNPLSIQPLLAAGLTEVFECFGTEQPHGPTRQQRQVVWRSMQAFVEVAERMSAGQRAMEMVMTAQREGPPKPNGGQQASDAVG